jgi:hypothetical protein
MTKIVTVRDDGYLLMEDFKDLLDIEKVVYYNIRHKKDGTIVLKFYDKKKKFINVNEQK